VQPALHRETAETKRSGSGSRAAVSAKGRTIGTGRRWFLRKVDVPAVPVDRWVGRDHPSHAVSKFNSENSKNVRPRQSHDVWRQTANRHAAKWTGDRVVRGHWRRLGAVSFPRSRDPLSDHSHFTSRGCGEGVRLVEARLGRVLRIRHSAESAALFACNGPFHSVG